MKLLSLFSGIGAFEKALNKLKISYELVSYCDIDKYASKSYAAIHNVPESMNLWDITKVDEKALPKDIDLVTYGFPCQDISLVGGQRGMKLLCEECDHVYDISNEMVEKIKSGEKLICEECKAEMKLTRSGLFFEALRIIEATQPRVAIAENVKNLTSKKFNAQFQIVLGLLEQAGYNNYWQVLNAKDYGIPQKRKRVFIVSIRKDIDTGCFRFPEGFLLKLRLQDMLEDEVDEKYYLSMLNVQENQMVSVPSFVNGDICRTVRASGHGSTDRHSWDMVKCKKTSRIRKLTPKECFRLMGFDDSDFEKAEAVNSSAQLYKQAGNSIVVDVPFYIIRSLIQANIL